MWIQNISYADVEHGRHKWPVDNTMMINIVDPAYTYPRPKYEFEDIYRFEFLDLEDDDPCDEEGFKIDDNQAEQLVYLLQRALTLGQNVIVSCHAGVCRSGAVAEVGVMMGFEDTHAYRQPNLRVKHKMMRALGWTYDSAERPRDNWAAYSETLEGKQ